MGGVQQYLFKLEGTPVDQASCTTPMIPAQVFMATVRTEQLVDTSTGYPYGAHLGAEFHLEFSGCGDAVNSIKLEFNDAFGNGSCSQYGYQTPGSLTVEGMGGTSKNIVIAPYVKSEASGILENIWVCESIPAPGWARKTFTLVPVSGSASLTIAALYFALPNFTEPEHFGSIAGAMKVLVTYN